MTASYDSGSLTTMTLPARTYNGCPDDLGNPQTSSYPSISQEIGITPESTTYEPFLSESNKSKSTTGRSFEAAKKAGEIVMNPYSVMKKETENFVHTNVHRQGMYRWVGLKSFNSFGCDKVFFDRQAFIGEYVNRFDLSRLIRVWDPAIIDLNYIDEEEIDDAINSTQTAAFAEALSGYDILTEIAESRETIRFIHSKVAEAAKLLTEFASEDEQTFKRARRYTPKRMLRSANKTLRKFGGRWMEYRYALMPLFYSFQDIQELLNDNGARFVTNRARETIVPHDRPTMTPSDPFWCERRLTGTVTVSSTVKQRYDGAGLMDLYQRKISSNPLQTAWELVPFSFVADWFLNIGDVITSQTSVNFASATAGCTAVKRDLQEETVYVQQHQTDTFPAREWEGISIPEMVYNIRDDVTAVLSRSTLKSYDRTLFNAPKATVTFNPSLNWKRLIDGAVLAQQPINKILRSLK